MLEVLRIPAVQDPLGPGVLSAFFALWMQHRGGNCNKMVGNLNFASIRTTESQ